MFGNRFGRIFSLTGNLFREWVYFLPQQRVGYAGQAACAGVRLCPQDRRNMVAACLQHRSSGEQGCRAVLPLACGWAGWTSSCGGGHVTL